MSLGALGRTLMKPFRRAATADERRLAELGKRIEQRAEVGSLEARAYVDASIAALQGAPSDAGRQIERRGMLAAQEAKAYADGAVYSLSMAIKGMSAVVLRLSQRVEACEALLAQGGAVSQRLDALSRHDETLDGKYGDLALRLDSAGQRIEGMDSNLRDLGKDLVDVETALREIDGQLNAAMARASSPTAPVVADRPVQ